MWKFFIDVDVHNLYTSVYVFVYIWEKVENCGMKGMGYAGMFQVYQPYGWLLWL